jgi:hypothetical protein
VGVVSCGIGGLVVAHVGRRLLFGEIRGSEKKKAFKICVCRADRVGYIRK